MLTRKFFSDHREWLTRMGFGVVAAVALVYVFGRIGVVTGSPEGGSIFQTVSWATGWWHGAISDAVTFSIPVVFWVAGLFKLKEIEL